MRAARQLQVDARDFAPQAQHSLFEDGGAEAHADAHTMMTLVDRPHRNRSFAGKRLG